MLFSSLFISSPGNKPNYRLFQKNDHIVFKNDRIIIGIIVNNISQKVQKNVALQFRLRKVE